MQGCILADRYLLCSWSAIVETETKYARGRLAGYSIISTNPSQGSTVVLRSPNSAPLDMTGAAAMRRELGMGN